MDHNSPIVSCKKDLIDFLKSRKELNYVDIRENYIKTDKDLPLKKPLITISKGKMIGKDISYQNYFGEIYDDDSNEIIETKGKILNLYYDIHIWNGISPKLGGEKEIERIQEKIQSIVEFESNALENKGITFFNFEEGTAIEDPFENYLFHCRCTIQLQVLWKKEFRYEVMDEIESHGEIEEG
ncbi:hypothetical protein FQB35_10465 [Crassaminicella thermophila]|uniref:Uncharacterized protein n=1 Tax=Crassaminicella thermophila TaxID=2599308 RepID=A0A5C0SIE6_CRATE|nr:hypothetical protein [Crassaminicella thermophila]QEK12719.1 hypothetical protein FQB35_10465 [Crassaminicella thermophila]